MTESFSRPGAVDLSGMKGGPQAGQQSGPQPGLAGRPGAGAGAGSGSGRGSGAYTVTITAENFQSEMQHSVSVPVVVCFHSPQSPDSQQLVDTLGRLADEFEGRFLLATVDVDANPQIAQTVGVPGVPLVAVALGGQLAPIAQQNIPEADLRQVLQQVTQTAIANGMTGRAEPRTPQQQPPQPPEEDPKYAEADAALAAGDIDGAIAAYQRVLDADPGDLEARRGLGAAQLMKRTEGVDVAAARSAAADRPGDVEAQSLAADLDLIGGHVEDAFERLVRLVQRTSGDDRNAARSHLLELFDLVGNEDPRVLSYRTKLANALF